MDATKTENKWENTQMQTMQRGILCEQYLSLESRSVLTKIPTWNSPAF